MQINVIMQKKLFCYKYVRHQAHLSPIQKLQSFENPQNIGILVDCKIAEYGKKTQWTIKR